MRIEWVIPCTDIQRPHDGLYTLVGIGTNGFLLTPGVVGVVELPVMVGFIIEEDDEPGETDEIWYQVIGPDAHPITPIRVRGIEWAPRIEKPWVEPERDYVPLTVEFDVSVGGSYTLEVGNFTETKEIPLWVQEMASPDD